MNHNGVRPETFGAVRTGVLSVRELCKVRTSQNCRTRRACPGFAEQHPRRPAPEPDEIDNILNLNQLHHQNAERLLTSAGSYYVLETQVTHRTTLQNVDVESPALQGCGVVIFPSIE